MKKDPILVKEPCKLVMGDVQGPFPSLFGKMKYSVTITDHFSKVSKTAFMMKKSEVTTAIKSLMAEMEMDSKRPIEELRVDADVWRVHGFQNMVRDRGTKLTKSRPRMPSDIGLVERGNWTRVNDMITQLVSAFGPAAVRSKTVYHAGGFRKSTEGLKYALWLNEYVRNTSKRPWKDESGGTIYKSPMEVLTGSPYTPMQRIAFGTKVLAYKDKAERKHKLDTKARECL